MRKRPYPRDDQLSDEESEEDESGLDQYPDGQAIVRDHRGRVIPRVLCNLPTVPRHEGDRGFAPVRFVRKHTMPDHVIKILQSKAARASLGPGSAALTATKDAWQLVLGSVDTMSLRAFALACSKFAIVARDVLSRRLSEHPFITSPVHLSAMQYHAFSEAVYRRRNLFITGEAGSGKTVLLRTIVDTLRRTDAETGTVHPYSYFEQVERLVAEGYDASQSEVLMAHNRKRFLSVLVVAPTGTAAEACGGQTSASVFGSTPTELVSDWERYRSPYRRGDEALVMDADVLVWDEVSMVSCQGLEHAERVSRQFRRNNKLFGGLQTIFFGDFAQLPPVSKGRDPHPQLAKRCFLSPVWRRLFGDPFSVDSRQMILLPCSMRQDPRHARFIKCLRELRTGQASPTVSTIIEERFWQHLNKVCDPCMKMPSVVIASTNAEVDKVNEGRIRMLITNHKAYERYYHSWLSRVRSAAYQDPTLDLPRFRMVVGARVSLTRNALYHHLSNGSMGEVVDKADLGDPSVIRRIERGSLIFLSNINYSLRMKTTGEICLLTKPALQSLETVYPVVEFNSQPGRFYVIGYWTTPVNITREEEKTDGELKRFEVPLRIAFAQSTHRWQGGTIPLDVAARVQLADAFAPELIYVALSRVRTPDQLIITSKPIYERFYGPAARQTICPDTARFLRVQQLRLEHVMLQAEALETERRLLEKQYSRSSKLSRSDQ